MHLDLLAARHPDGRQEEERAEDVRHELEAVQQHSTCGDERRTEDERAEDPPEQDVVLVLGRNVLRHGGGCERE